MLQHRSRRALEGDRGRREERHQAQRDRGEGRHRNGAASSYLIGIAYYWENYRAPALYFYGSHPCSDTLYDVDFYAEKPGAQGFPLSWNHNIRSFQGYNNCYLRLADWDYFTGEWYGYAGASANLGRMNDRASSISFS